MLTTEQKLRIENFKLRVTVHNLSSRITELETALSTRNGQITATNLQYEKDLLEKEFGKIDWNTLEIENDSPEQERADKAV